MTTYLITNRIACTILGLFEAASEDDAVAAMIRDAGYRDAVHEAEVLESTVEKLRDELVVTEVDVPAAITALAHEMVRCYRVCGDDLSAADMIDDNAHHADDWDHVGVGACGVTAGLRPSLVEALWQQYRDDLRAAYVAAWRAAVTLDLAATVTALAASMVVHDRDSSDCDAVRDDADAGGSCGWDADGVLAAAEAADVDDALAAAVWEQYPHLVREAYAKAWRAAVELDLAARDEVAAVEAAIRLESDLTRHSRQDDGSYIIALDDGDDDALARIAAALPLGWQIDWTGDGNTDADGDSTSDAHVWRGDDAA